MSKIFISYRHDDSADVTGRLYDRLTQRFGRDSVIRDLDSIPLGVDFREFLTSAVEKCRVFLAVIGERWLGVQDESGRRRLDNPDDFVRIEIEAALRREIPVIPVLVQGSHIPDREQLPPSLTGLVYATASRRGTIRTRQGRASADRSLKRVLGTGVGRGAGSPRQTPQPLLPRASPVWAAEEGMYAARVRAATSAAARRAGALYGHRDVIAPSPSPPAGVSPCREAGTRRCGCGTWRPDARSAASKGITIAS